MISISTESSMDDGGKHGSLHDKIKIVSQQSTARPGCVIQLDAIADATHVIFYLLKQIKFKVFILYFPGLAKHAIFARIPRTTDFGTTRSRWAA